MIYADNAATTRPASTVVDAVRLTLVECWGNPSSAHRPGLDARTITEDAREVIARYCTIPAEGVIFTSGGTEANQLAALGLPIRPRSNRVICTNAEHPSLSRAIASRGDVEVVYTPVRSDGVVDLERFGDLLNDQIGLVALFEGQNEIGSRNPIAEIVALARARAPRAFIHLDSVQAFGKPEPPPFSLGIDSASVSAHKVHGPKGVGALLLRSRIGLSPQILGGGQENDRRSGTENVPGIAGFGEAVRLLALLRPEDHARMRGLRQKLQSTVLDRLPGARALVTTSTGLPHILVLVLPGAPAEVVLHHLEREGIVASASAACHSKKHELSPALRAIGLRDDEIRSTLRLSLSRETSDADVDAIIEALPRIVSRVRALGAVR